MGKVEFVSEYENEAGIFMVWSANGWLFELPVGADNAYIMNAVDAWDSWLGFMRKEIVGNKAR